MISLEDRRFNGLMGTLKVPYRYHKTLYSAGRNQKAPSADLTDWLPIENADNVWHQVRALLNVSSRQNNPVDEYERSVATGPGLPISNSHAQTTSKYKPTPLPDEYPAYMLEESKRYYQDLPEGETIPFLVSKRKKEKVRTIVLATSDGKRPDVPLKVQIYLRDWDSKFAFWTMDINNKRVIVKNMSGAPNGGCKYNYWAGPDRGLEGPIAFSDNSATGNSRKAPYTDYVEIDSDAEDLQQEEITEGTRSGQYFKEEIEIDDLFNPLQAESTAYNTSQENPDSIIPWPFADDEEESPSLLKLEEDPVPSEVASHRKRWSLKVTSSSAGDPSYNSGIGTIPQTLPAKRRETATTSDLFDHLGQGPSGLKARSKSTLSARRSRSIPIEEAAQAPKPHETRKSLASGSSGTSPSRRNPQCMSTLTARPSKNSQPEEIVQESRPPVAQQNQVSSSSNSIPSALSPEKQENTWLQIRLEQDGFNRVKKFRSCFTVSQFFTLIADAWKIAVDDLERAEVTIDGAGDNQKPYKIELMPNDDEEYMEALTGRIDAWPLEKGRCNVDVVIYRHGQGILNIHRWTVRSSGLIQPHKPTMRFTFATKSDPSMVPKQLKTSTPSEALEDGERLPENNRSKEKRDNQVILGPPNSSQNIEARFQLIHTAERPTQDISIARTGSSVDISLYKNDLAEDKEGDIQEAGTNGGTNESGTGTKRTSNMRR